MDNIDHTFLEHYFEAQRRILLEILFQVIDANRSITSDRYLHNALKRAGATNEEIEAMVNPTSLEKV